MAIFSSIEEAMRAGGYTGSRLSGNATYWTRQVGNTTRTVNPKYTTGGASWGGAPPADYYLDSGGGSASGGSTVTNPNPQVMSAVASAVPSNIDRMREAQATGSSLAQQEAAALDPAISQQFENALARANPRAREIQSQMAANTEAMLRGEIPPDVANLIRQVSAEQNMQGTMANVARNLGLTSLDISQRGFQQGLSLQEMSSRYLTAPTVDIAGTSARIREQLFGAQSITPGEAGSLAAQSESLRAQVSAQNAEMQWARELSEMNRQREAYLDKQQAELYERAIAAQQAEEAAELGSFRSNVSSLSAAQTSNEAYLARLRTPTGGTRYRMPGSTLPYSLSSPYRNF